MLIFERGLLNGAESSAFGKALWSEKHTIPTSLPEGTPLLDWAFLIHPQPNPGMAEQRFRLKWLSGDTSRIQDSVQRDGNTISVSLGSRPQDPDRIEDILWNVGSAMSGLRNHGLPLRLTDDERKYIADVVDLWVESDVIPKSLSFFPAAAAEPTRWAIRGLASILAEGVVPKSVGERIYEKVKRLDESRTPGFELIHGLIKTIPDQSEELLTWLRMGLASDDDDLTRSAMLGLHSWLAASAKEEEASPSPPPNDMLSEVGFMIASRRSAALPHALQLAKWVFDHGTPDYQESVGDLAMHGLWYLAEELRYDRDRSPEDDIDIPLLRWLCAELAQSMAQRGFGDEPGVSVWLRLGKGDPLPEVRYAVEPVLSPKFSPAESRD